MRRSKPLPSREFLLERLIYSKEDGKLFYKKSGKEVAKDNGNGYIYGGIGPKNNHVSFLAHRVIFFLETGEEPEEVDHIDHNRKNNHISNLRGVTRSQNHANKPINKTSKNTSKYKGVYWNKRDKRWIAQTKINQKSFYLGSFKDEKEAALAYNNFMIKKFGKHAYLNTIEE